MIVETSDVIAILWDEPESKDLVQAIRGSRTSPKISAASYVEMGAIIDQARDPIASGRADEFSTLGV